MKFHESLIEKRINLDQLYVPPEIIPEAGTGHQGNLEQAALLIQTAQQAGAKKIKFQWVIASEILHPKTGQVPLPGGLTELYDIFTKLEQPKEFYRDLVQLCEAQGIEFLCTPFGLESLQSLLELPIKQIKIASPELNHHPLLHGIGKSGLPVLLSTGVSLISDIEESLTILQPFGNEICLLHCVTAYPAPPEDYNLLVTDSLRNIFGIPVGVSDHSLDPILIPAMAGLLDCPVVEKHLGLTKKGRGLDDPIALEPGELTRLIDTLEGWRNKPKIRVLEELVSQYSSPLVRATLGDGKKKLAPAEMQNYGRTNRSIHALHELYPGDILTTKNIGILRTEKKLCPGLHPRYYPTLLGKKLTHPVENGQGIIWDYLFV